MGCLSQPPLPKVKNFRGEGFYLFQFCFISNLNVDIIPETAEITLHSGGKHMLEVAEQENGTQAVLSALTLSTITLYPRGSIHIAAFACETHWTTILRDTICTRPFEIVKTCSTVFFFINPSWVYSQYSGCDCTQQNTILNDAGGG